MMYNLALLRIYVTALLALREDVVHVEPLKLLHASVVNGLHIISGQIFNLYRLLCFHDPRGLRRRSATNTLVTATTMRRADVRHDKGAVLQDPLGQDLARRNRLALLLPTVDDGRDDRIDRPSLRTGLRE